MVSVTAADDKLSRTLMSSCYFTTTAPYELKRYARDPVTRMGGADLKAVHKLGRSPLLTDGDVTVAESGAIVHYLLEHYDSGSKLGDKLSSGTPASAELAFWLHFAEAGVMLHWLPLWNLRKAGIMTKDGSNSAEQTAVPGIKVDLAYVEETLKANRSGGENGWLVGNSFTAADNFLTFGIDIMTRMLELQPKEWADNLGLEVGPETRKWLEACYARPAYKAALRAEGVPEGEDWLAPLLANVSAESRQSFSCPELLKMTFSSSRLLTRYIDVAFLNLFLSYRSLP